jgi:DNA-binding NtrC family response regulator/tetratricopeptide (TPR) repeat protein
MYQPLYVRAIEVEERDALEQHLRSANREESCRASVILLSSEGKSAPEISKLLGSHPSNIKKWIRRFNTQGISGIAVKKRGPQGGPRPRFTPEQIDMIVSLAERSPYEMGYGFKEWTPQKLATVAVERGIVERISHVTVRQILKRHEAIKPAPGAGLGVADVRGEAVSAGPRTEFGLGEAALAQSQYDVAVAHFRAALDEKGISNEEEASIRVLLSKGLEELSKYEEAYTAISAYEDSRMLGLLGARTRARVKLRLGWVDCFLGKHPKAIASLNEAKRVFFELGDELGMSEVHYALGRTYIELNEFRIARDHLIAAINAQKTARDRELLALVYQRLGTVDFGEGAFSSSKEFYLQALELAEGSANTNLIGGILVNLGTMLFGGELSDKQEAIKYLQRGIGYLEKGGHKDFLVQGYNNLGDTLRYSGLWEDAVLNLNKAIETARQFSLSNHEAIARTTLAEILCARGRFDDAEQQLATSLSLIEGHGDKWLESNILRILASVYKATGRIDSALKTLRQTLQLSTSIGDLYGVTLAMVGLAEVHISQGGHDQAREYLELAQGRLKEEMYLPVSGLIQRLIGQLEAARGRLAEAKQHIAQSISIFTTTDIPYDLAKSYYEMGLLLRQARDLSGFETYLKKAKEKFERLGAEPDLEQIQKALSSIAQAEQTAQVLKVNPQNDVLLMQRLIEASASRELLLQELAAVVCENFPVDQVAICRVEDTGRAEPLVVQGISRLEAERFCARNEFTLTESISRAVEGYTIRIGEDARHPIIIYVKTDSPPDLGRLQPLLKQAELGLETCQLRAAARGSTTRNVEQRIQTIMPGFIVASPSMFDVIEKIIKIRTSDVTVLITGESGTGKELVARHIHGQSARARAIFLPFNCTATPKDIIDSQLFGHRRGAFTGATANYPGIIKAAEGGTLFLDEIGDLSLEVQPKLMRFLQEGEIQPLGETKPIRVDVRILAATNTDLEKAVEDGRFREDLFHRLNIIRIHVPPLRERREEIPVLASHFLEHFSSRSGKPGVTMTQSAVDALGAYDWPGNVRQLRNEIERVVAYAYEGARISPDDLSPEVIHPRRLYSSDRSGSFRERGLNGGANGALRYSRAGSEALRKFETGGRHVKLKEATAALERELIQDALARNRNNLSRTALDLGLSRRGLRLKLVQLGIQKSERV